MRRSITLATVLCLLAGGMAFPKTHRRSKKPCQEKELLKDLRDPKALEKENYVIDHWRLERVENEEVLTRLKKDESKLVPVPSSGPHYFIDDHLDSHWYFIRPFTLDFMEEMARKFYRFLMDSRIKIRRIKITGLVRDRPYQQGLVRRLPSGQAAPAESDSDKQSSHLSGATFDFSTKDWTRQEICWIANYLLERKRQQEVSVIWEINSNAFHVMVFPFPTETPLQ